jgi:hypothetical protein
MATILGVSFVIHQMGSMTGGGGLIFDAFGSYDRAWQIGVRSGLNRNPDERMTKSIIISVQGFGRPIGILKTTVFARVGLWG